MSVNVKIGDHIENGVDSVKLENADSLGTYVSFVEEKMPTIVNVLPTSTAWAFNRIEIINADVSEGSQPNTIVIA